MDHVRQDQVNVVQIIIVARLMLHSYVQMVYVLQVSKNASGMTMDAWREDHIDVHIMVNA